MSPFTSFNLNNAMQALATGCAGLLAALALSSAQAATVPAKGTAATLDIASWNIEWFGDTANGPTDEAAQLANAKAIISGTDMDIWGLAEIVSTSKFSSLKSGLTGYSGIVASDTSVVDGATYYAATEQKPALLWKTSLATLLDARLILTTSDYDFAGRPPMQAKLRVTLNGTTEDIVIVVMHAKCCSDSTSWSRRQNAAVALKNYLDANFPSQKVWVVGDFNDDLDTSITTGSATPYANFLSDTARYTFVTKALTNAGTATTVDYTDTIDHHLTTNEAYAQYVANSVEAFRADQYITGYGTSTSDHYPIFSRYNWAAGTTSVTVNSPNGGESWVGGSAHNITWSSSYVTNVKLETTTDGSTWSTLTSSTPASAGSYAWTVPNIATSSAKVRVTDVSSGLADTSNANFTITASGTAANVILNEICANEPGSATAGEFVEIVNAGGTSISIAGWTLSDSTAVRHTFATGTTLAAGKAIAVFGGSTGIPSGLSNAVAASTGTLALGNSGDSVTLKNASGTVMATYTYTSVQAGTDGVSVNRSPDGSASGSWVLHNTLSTLGRSAGLKASGSAW